MGIVDRNKGGKRKKEEKDVQHFFVEFMVHFVKSQHLIVRSLDHSHECWHFVLVVCVRKVIDSAAGMCPTSVHYHMSQSFFCCLLSHDSTFFLLSFIT